MDIEKKAIAREALQALSEIEASTNMENLVKDNKIEFILDDKTYRIRKPSFAERNEIDSARRKKYLTFISDDTYFFRKTWIAKYLAKSIDINAMEAKVKSYQADIESVLLRLAVAIEPKDVEMLKKEIYSLRDAQFSLSMEVTDLLAHCIEQQLLVFTNSYTTFVVLEHKVGEDWKKLYDNYDKFMSEDSKIIDQSFMYISYLIYQYAGESK